METLDYAGLVSALGKIKLAKVLKGKDSSFFCSMFHDLKQLEPNFAPSSSKMCACE